MADKLTVAGYGTGCLHHTHLHIEAQKVGAVCVCESAGKMCVWQVEAPDGKVWADGGVSSLRVEWRKGDSLHRDAAIRDAILRIRAGLVDDTN